MCTGLGSNQGPLDPKFDALTTAPLGHLTNVIMRLGGMHTLMSFVGSIGTLMAGSGLYELLESTFAGVQKMMTGKHFPQNVRALRLVTEAFLRPILSK